MVFKNISLIHNMVNFRFIDTPRKHVGDAHRDNKKLEYANEYNPSGPIKDHMHFKSNDDFCSRNKNGKSSCNNLENGI